MGLRDWTEISEKPRNQILETPVDYEKGKEKLEPVKKPTPTEQFADRYKVDNKDNHIEQSAIKKSEKPDKNTANTDSEESKGNHGRDRGNPFER